MGMVRCQKHGPQFLIEMCEHALADIENSREAVMVRVCPACYEQTGMARFEGIEVETCSEQDSDAYCEAYEQLNRRVYCSVCVRETAYYTAKNAGRPLPFPGYEHTLTYQELSVIDELEAWLKNRYSFPISQDPHSRGKAAFWLAPGTIEEPFTLQFYYITDAESQQQLLALIDEFFLPVQLKQRKVKFFEAERWHEEIRANGGSYQILPALLVREVTVD